MDRYSRWTALLEILEGGGRLTVDDAARRLGVSAATVRRDFEAMARQRMIVRTRGAALRAGNDVALALAHNSPGAVPAGQLPAPRGVPAVRPAVPHVAHGGYSSDAARRVAVAAVALLPPGTSLGMTGGHATVELAQALAARPASLSTDARQRTVVTNDLALAGALVGRPGIKLVLSGGVARPPSYGLVGPLAARTFDGLALDVAVIDAGGVDADGGVTTDDEEGAEVARLMARCAARVIVLAAPGALGRRAFAQVCEAAGIVVVTDSAGADQSALDRLAEAGVQVVLAGQHTFDGDRQGRVG